MHRGVAGGEGDVPSKSRVSAVVGGGGAVRHGSFSRSRTSA